MARPHRCILLGLVGWFFSLAATAGELAPNEGDPVPPAFVLDDIRGQQHALEDYRGQVVLVHFWASWCRPCVIEMPSLQRLNEKMSGKPFTLLAINVGEPKYRVWKFVELVDFHLPVPLDLRKDTFEAWGVRVLPTTFLLDKAGRVRYRVQGDLAWDTDEAVAAAIEALLSEHP